MELAPKGANGTTKNSLAPNGAPPKIKLAPNGAIGAIKNQFGSKGAIGDINIELTLAQSCSIPLKFCSIPV
ncbi:hypothetical protein V9T40_011700 [Parthenolecanium corni]|uniref:Uncharacterized protein n=1 Tax=Parthenolecanium corni TaxID=536013 RepID=A0AAN9T9E3_9HEMI